MKISLSAGLVLRVGARTLEVVRQLSETDYQVEDCVSRRPSVLTRKELLDGIWNKKFEVVLGTSAASQTPAGAEGEQSGEIDITTLSEADQAVIEYRLAYVKGLQAAHVTRGQRQGVRTAIAATAEARKKKAAVAGIAWLEKVPSDSTVMAWARVYQSSGCSPLSLLSGNRRRHRAPQLDPKLESLISKIIREVYLTKERHSLQHTLTRICSEARRLVETKELAADKATVSLSTLSRRVQTVDLYRRTEARYGSARARMVCRTTYDGAGASYPLERAEIDHTLLNWVVICDRTGLPLGRPVLTAMIDAYSGYVLGFYLSFYGPGLTSVSGVIRNAVIPKDDLVAGFELEHRWLSHGVPDEAIVDNGLEFHAKSFRLMSWDLGMDLMYCRVRTPWLKPHVERFFSTLNYLTLVKGRVHKRVANVLNLDPMKDAAIRFSDLVKGLTMFVTDVHPHEVNQRKLAKPYDLMLGGLERCPPAAYPGSWDQLKLTSALSKQLTIDPGGIELHGLPYGGGELRPLHHRYGERFKTLVKWDPDDIEFVYVQDPADKSWIRCPSRWPEYTAGRSWNQHLLTRQFAREELKENGALESLQRAQLRLHEHWMGATARHARADALTAARAAGVSSAKIFKGEEAVAPKPETVIARSEVVVETAEVPDFEGFLMRRAA